MPSLPDSTQKGDVKNGTRAGLPELAKSQANRDAIDVPLTKSPNLEFNTSFAALLANPDRYHGKKIRLEGFLHVEFEGNAIYSSKDHADHLITHEAFWVSFDKVAIPFEGIVGPKEFHRRWVMIEGTFDKNRRGHLSGWSGEINDIDRVLALEKYYSD